MSDASSDQKLETTPTRRWQRALNFKKTGNSGFGNPIRVIANTLLIFIASQMLAIFFVEVGLSVLHRGGASLTDALDSSAPAQFFYVLIAEGMAIALVLGILKNRGLPLAAIGLGRRPGKRDLKKALLGFGAFYVLVILITALMTLLFPSLNIDQKQDVGFNNLPTLFDGILAFVALVFMPPLGEETLVRGYLYSGLRSRWKFAPALIATSILFALAHLQFGNSAGLVWGAAVNTFILSVVLVYLRENTGALYAGMLVHGLNNAIAYTVHFHGALF